MPLRLGKDLEKIKESYLLAFGKQQIPNSVVVCSPCSISNYMRKSNNAI